MIGSLAQQLPEHCDPSNEFLYSISLTFNSCIPTPLALISTILGVLSILSWLFAQIPQIIKNFNLRSTSGLSAFFLGEWLLGDVSNLLGSLFTGQATWQVVLATYYCCVDCVLCAQWVWYEYLRHGRKVRRVRWWTRSRAVRDDEAISGTTKSAMPSVEVNGVPVKVPKSKPIASRGKIPGPGFSPAGTPSEGGGSWLPSSIFSRPQFASYSSADSTLTSSPPADSRPIIRTPRPASPVPSPRTVLYITLLICLAARANPTTTSPTLTSKLHTTTATSHPITHMIGTIFSWLSTILYLGSRLPQLLHNASRRSTEGLSPTLFLAAFFGNLFYSSSLLTNPSLWSDMRPYGGRGWADANGNDHLAWMARAAPFFLGAAGVLLLDGAVGVQFLWYAKQQQLQQEQDDDNDNVHGMEASAVLVVEAENVRGAGRWRRVSGWMRGWTPAATSSWTQPRRSSSGNANNSVAVGGGDGNSNSSSRSSSSVNKHKTKDAGETDRLLGGPAGSSAVGGYGAGSRNGQQKYGTTN